MLETRKTNPTLISPFHPPKASKGGIPERRRRRVARMTNRPKQRRRKPGQRTADYRMLIALIFLILISSFQSSYNSTWSSTWTLPEHIVASYFSWRRFRESQNRQESLSSNPRRLKVSRWSCVADCTRTSRTGCDNAYLLSSKSDLKVWSDISVTSQGASLGTSTRPSPETVKDTLHFRSPSLITGIEIVQEGGRWESLLYSMPQLVWARLENITILQPLFSSGLLLKKDQENGFVQRDAFPHCTCIRLAGSK